VTGMNIHALGRRERLLAIWVQDRLGERAAVKWAINFVARVRSGISDETADLLEFLARHAQQQESLSASTRLVWQLLHHAAKGRRSGGNWHDFYRVRERAKQGQVQQEDIELLVQCVRPRLRAEDVSPWVASGEGEQDDPMKWVSWSFRAECGSLSQTAGDISVAILKHISSSDVVRLLEIGTDALQQSIGVAKKLGWLSDERDIPNLLVHRVFVPEGSDLSSTNDEEDDADRYNSNFVPIVRLLSNAFAAIADSETDSARVIAQKWSFESNGLFTRLYAFALWHGVVANGDSVSRWLMERDEKEFWRWIVFPEIASVRGLRWQDILPDDRARLEARLLNGPRSEAFGSGSEIAPDAIAFHRDHEIARLVDAALPIPPKFGDIVAQRRAEDPEFPRLVPRVEPGLVRSMSVREGDTNGKRFDSLSGQELIIALADYLASKHFSNDADEFARRLSGRSAILSALSTSDVIDENRHVAWSLLLSHPDPATDDVEQHRAVAQATIDLALQQPDSFLCSLVSSFCYWLDRIDEKIAGLRDTEELWRRVLPFAAAEANGEYDKQSQDGTTNYGKDITHAALNEPLGHLLSWFLRKCKPLRPGSTQEAVPARLAHPLKGLSGRAQEIMANRLVMSSGYFYQAEPEWFERIVVEPMISERPEGHRLWEAAALYAGILPSPVWNRLQTRAFKHLFLTHLSPDARRQLAEIAVIAWSLAKRKRGDYKIKSSELRTAFGLASDDVRAAAAWRYWKFFNATEKGTETEENLKAWSAIGVAFFREIWPLESSLQSSSTSHHFAAVPAITGFRNFEKAVSTILPFLRHFEVWATQTDLWLDPAESRTREIARSFPESLLSLLIASIDEQQTHGIYGLREILEWIEESQPNYASDSRMRVLRRFSVK
jgi:hypothetical protein